MRFNTLSLFALGLIVFTGLSHTPSIAEELTPTVTVSGSGSVSIAPDIAIITVGVIKEAKTAREALSSNNAAMELVLTEMRTFGIENEDLQTSNFSIQPRYVFPKRKPNGEQPAPQIIGYTVNNDLTVRIRDLSKTGTILDKVVSLGVNSGGRIQFANEDTEIILTQARERAVKNAISKAQTLTGAANVALGQILSINETSNRPRPVAINQARSLAVQESAGAVPIAGGENKYRVDVTISWAIDQ